MEINVVNGFDVKLPLGRMNDLKVLLCFKGDDEIPFFSLDERFDVQETLSDAGSLGLRTKYLNGAIIIKAFKREDAGKYRCRADRKLHASTHFYFEVIEDDYPVINLFFMNKPFFGKRLTMKCDGAEKSENTTYNFIKDHKIITSTDNIEISGNTITILQVQSSDTGSYSCGALNKRGRTTSAEVEMQPLVGVPQCLLGTESNLVSTIAGSDLNITCEVFAPSPSITGNVSFIWTYFSAEGEKMNIPEQYIKVNGSRSSVNLLPIKTASIKSLGHVECLSYNNVGFQDKPCITYIKEAEIPHPPYDCRWIMISAGFNMSCEAGFDGGLMQTFELKVHEIYKNKNRHDQDIEHMLGDEESLDLDDEPIMQVTQKQPEFFIDGLAIPSFSVYIYSVNAKGRSKPLKMIMNLESQPPVTEESKNEGKNEDYSFYLQMVMLSTVLSTFFLCAVLYIFRKYHGKKNPSKDKKSELPPSILFKHEGFEAPPPLPPRNLLSNQWPEPRELNELSTFDEFPMIAILRRSNTIEVQVDVEPLPSRPPLPMGLDLSVLTRYPPVRLRSERPHPRMGKIMEEDLIEEL